MEEQSLVSQLCLKTISIHDYSQLSELKNYILGEKQVILIARITPLMEKDPEHWIQIDGRLVLLSYK